MSSVIAPEPAPAGLSGHAFSTLFQAVTGLRNRRAIAAMLGCAVAGVIVVGLLLALSTGFLVGLLAAIVWVVAIGTGVNAAGLLQMDHARGISPRSLGDALAYGLMCIPKLIVLGLAFFAVEIAVFIVLALLLLICKIPFLGALLFVVVFPLCVVVAGVTIAGLFICMVLSLPAIWQGASITRALAQTLAIVRSRLVETVLLLVFVGFICFAVAMIVFGVLGTGLLPTLGMSYSILGFGGVGADALAAMSSGYGGGHAIAGAIGSALLWAIAASLVGQVYLLGLSLVYLRVTEGLDLTASEAALRATFDDARRRTAELAEKARQAAQRDGASTTAAAGAAAAAHGSASDHHSAPDHGSSAAHGSPPPYNPTPAYNPPPAYSPPPSFDTTAADARGSLAHGDEPTLAPGAASSGSPDIALPFDEPAAPATPAFGAPPAWTPPPSAAPLPPAAPLPTATTCPQCLSPVTPEDVFCGVCGYRLK